MQRHFKYAFINTSFLKIANLLLTTSLFFICGCTSSELSKNQLRISFSNYPGTTDPRICGDLISSSLACLLYEGMTRCGPEGVLEFALAQSVDLSDDHLTYTFHLRPSCWSDGEPVTAFDFERSWKRVLDPSFPAICPYLFFTIKNGEKSYKNEISSQEIAILALDDLTLQVTLERPTPHFLSLTSFPCFMPAPSHVRPDGLISNGPFCLKSAKPNAELILARNPTYWNSEQIKLEEIQITIVDCETTALRMFQRGELDFVGGLTSPLPIDSIPEFQDQIQFAAVPGTTFVAFNMQHSALQSQQLRRALSLSIDRDAIVKYVTQMGESPATRFIPPSLMGDQKELFPTYVPDQTILQTEELVLSYATSEINRKIATVLQEQWKKRLGIRVRLDPCERQSFRERLYHKDYQLALHFWVAQFQDPINILERFQDPSNLKNIPGWYSSRYCELTRLAQEDLSQRRDCLEQAEEILCEEMPLAPIYHWSSGWIHHPSLSNVSANSSGFILFERIVKS